MRLFHEEVTGFDRPTDIPKNETQHNEWQEKVRMWWNDHPMRYDWREPLGVEEFSKAFYQEIDKRFFSVTCDYMPWSKVPFDPLIDYESLSECDVLEIGVGNGSIAQLLAQSARSYTGIDITDYAVKSTSKRMLHFGLNQAKITKMDAENMEFARNSFDFIWTWGVIDHSANTERILKEMARVLRPGGRAVVMVYHRGWWNYHFVGKVIHGIICGGMFRTGSMHKAVQEVTDGPFSRFFTPSDWIHITSSYFKVNNIRICGPKYDLFPIPGSKFKSALMRLIPNNICCFLTNKCKMGGFLISTIQS